MGAISDRSYQLFIENRDVARETRMMRPGGTHTLLGAIGTNAGLSIFGNVLRQYASDPSGGGGGSTHLVGTNYQEQYDEILSKWSCNSAQDLETLAASKEIDLNDVLAKIEAHKITEPRDPMDFDYQDKMSTYNRKLTDLKTQKTKLEQEIEQIKKDQGTLKTLAEKIKEVNGENVLESFKNDEAQKIIDLLGELNVAQDTTPQNNDKINILKTDLETAIKTYYETHKKGENKTIDNLATVYKVAIPNS